MPKKRNKENEGLPSRWRFTRNAYYYQVPSGLEGAWNGKKTFKLGNSLPEAYRVWADRLDEMDNVKTIGDLLDRYALEVVPTKAVTTQTGNHKQIKMIRSVFGTMPVGSIIPQHAYQYADKRKAEAVKKGNSGVVSAKREIALLSHTLTKAVEWGYIPLNPLIGQVKIKGGKPRTRYIEDWEVDECMSLSTTSDTGGVAMIKAYINLKLLTGLRRGDLLRLTESNIKQDGLYVTTGKTGKSIVYEWTDALIEALDAVKAVRPIDFSPYLFCTRKGQCYFNEDGTASGWNSMWQRFMKRIMCETKVSEAFTEHDLRAKCASDADSLDHAQDLLAHTDNKITKKVYMRGAVRVKPLR
jgi:integrase